MKSVITGLLGLLLSYPATQALAREPDDEPDDTCYWETDPASQMVYRRDLGTLYVPRDARVGTVLGTVDMSAFTPNEMAAVLKCHNSGNVRLTFNARNTAPIFAGQIPPINGEDVTGKVLESGIRGVGVRIKLGFPFDGSANNAFVPADGRPVVPFDAHLDNQTVLSRLRMASLRNIVTLIKTGPLEPGVHLLDGRELFSGYFTGVNKAKSYGLLGTVIQAQCSVSSNPVSADPVQLGEWKSADFSQPGFTTTAVPFHITLSNCETDPNQADFATAHIKLDGVNGSLPIEPLSSGVFSLTSDSSARGVAIQILKGDGVTPVELGSAVPLIPISAGTTVLHFAARYYQTAASQQVQPGSAKGALSFTLTYQ